MASVGIVSSKPCSMMAYKHLYLFCISLASSRSTHLQDLEPTAAQISSNRPIQHHFTTNFPTGSNFTTTMLSITSAIKKFVAKAKKSIKDFGGLVRDATSPTPPAPMVLPPPPPVAVPEQAAPSRPARPEGLNRTLLDGLEPWELKMTLEQRKEGAEKVAPWMD